MDSKVNIVCWKWHPLSDSPKTKKAVGFTASHVNALYYMLQKNVTIPFDLICVTDDFEGILPEIIIYPLWDQWRNLGGCFSRLVCFQKDFPHFGNKFTSIDLDCIITGNIDDILLREEPFVIWQPENDINRIARYCGSLWTLEAGMHSVVYDRFTPRNLPPMRNGKYLGGTDQLHISKVLPNSPVYNSKDGVYNFVPDIFRKEGELPENAKIVFFNGRFMPDEIFLLSKCPWIAQHYPLAGVNTSREYTPKALRALRRRNVTTDSTMPKLHRTMQAENSAISIVLFWWQAWPENSIELGLKYVRQIVTDLTTYIPSYYQYQIILFSDMDIQLDLAEVRRLNVPANLRWNLKKMYMYSEEAKLSGNVLCFDLDTIIKGSIGPLIEQVQALPKDKLLITCEAAYKKGRIGGSVVGFKSSLKLTELLWIPIIRNQQFVESKTKGSERLFYRQQLLTTQVAFWEDLIPDTVVSYKKDCRDGFPENASVIRFHGQPRPHDVVQF